MAQFTQYVGLSPRGKAIVKNGEIFATYDCTTGIAGEPVIKEFKIRTDEITSAVNLLSKYYSICLTSYNGLDETGDEINHCVDAYLRELYRTNPYVNFVNANDRVKHNDNY
ncbi:hypothetical protein [Paenibacillus xylaniclasticus]|uniref:hypothetical protein n=1 Tax=Paenibacillus xylaniclasticus TaxID=588083 RepID=UPI000FD93698|nr:MULTISPECIES: hypothetical protein [Paenibacillus]GFN32529.1 hypothetical protein PCURB6_27890 [Paenibacillus curdlanolyticus]